MKIAPIASGMVSPLQVRREEAMALSKNSPTSAGQQATPIGSVGDSPINTEGIITLRTGSAEDSPFAILDQVIVKMKENINEIGKALETMKEMSEKTSKLALGLSVLEKTLEAMEKLRGDDK